MRRRAFLVAGSSVLALGIAGVAGARAQRALARFSKAPLAIRTGEALHRFTVELALTPRQQQQGLMFRRRMAADAGMLFLYRRPETITMWMQNTYLPLDMVFIGADARVMRIVERTTPMSTETISSGGPAIAVLELNAGTAARLGIARGDRVEAAVLGGSAAPR